MPLLPLYQSKLDNQFEPCLFLDYGINHLGHQCKSLIIRKFYISRHVIFYETIFPHSTWPFNSTPSTLTPLHPPSIEKVILGACSVYTSTPIIPHHPYSSSSSDSTGPQSQSPHEFTPTPTSNSIPTHPALVISTSTPNPNSSKSSSASIDSTPHHNPPNLIPHLQPLLPNSKGFDLFIKTLQRFLFLMLI